MRIRIACRLSRESLPGVEKVRDDLRVSTDAMVVVLSCEAFSLMAIEYRHRHCRLKREWHFDDLYGHSTCAASRMSTNIDWVFVAPGGGQSLQVPPPVCACGHHTMLAWLTDESVIVLPGTRCSHCTMLAWLTDESVFCFASANVALVVGSGQCTRQPRRREMAPPWHSYPAACVSPRSRASSTLPP